METTTAQNEQENIQSETVEIQAQTEVIQSEPHQAIPEAQEASESSNPEEPKEQQIKPEETISETPTQTTNPVASIQETQETTPTPQETPSTQETPEEPVQEQTNDSIPEVQPENLNSTDQETTPTQEATQDTPVAFQETTPQEGTPTSTPQETPTPQESTPTQEPTSTPIQETPSTPPSTPTQETTPQESTPTSTSTSTQETPTQETTPQESTPTSTPQETPQEITLTPTQEPTSTPTSPPQSPPPERTFGVLTEDQLLEAMYLTTSYRDFWANKKFSDGTDEPVFSLKSVEHLLEEAAEIVTQLRTIKPDTATAGPADGYSKEFLWSLESLPKPDEFVRGLIHATLQLADGSYPNGMTEESIDRKIYEIVQNNSFVEDKSRPHQLTLVYNEGKELENIIKEKWRETSELLNNALKDKPQLWSSSLVSDLKQILNAVDGVKNMINCFEARREFKKENSLRLSKRCKRSLSQEKKPPVVENQTPVIDEETKSGILKVENVQKKVAGLTEQILSLDSVLQNDLRKISDLVKKPAQSMEHIQEMKKKAAIYLDQLLKDLDYLDTIQGSGVRSMRKQEILHVQELIDNVEKVQEQIRKLEEEVKPAVEKEKEKEKEKEAAGKMEAEKKRKDAEELQKTLREKHDELQKQKDALRQRELALKEQSPPRSPDESPKSIKVNHPHTQQQQPISLEDSWRKIELDVDLRTQEGSDAYLIYGKIPNMDQKDIKIKLSEGNLVLEGFRGPTEGELAGMIRILQSRGDLARLSPQEKRMALLRMGVGRFGSWTSVYRLPEDAVVDKIQAEYTRGQLQIVIPKKKIVRGRRYQQYQDDDDYENDFFQDPRLRQRQYQGYPQSYPNRARQFQNPWGGYNGW